MTLSEKARQHMADARIRNQRAAYQVAIALRARAKVDDVEMVMPRDGGTEHVVTFEHDGRRFGVLIIEYPLQRGEESTR